MSHQLEDHKSPQRASGGALWWVDFHLLYIGGIIYILTFLGASVITWVPSQKHMPFLIAGITIQSVFLLPTLLTRSFDRQRRRARIGTYLLVNVIVVAIFGIVTGVSIYLIAA